MLTKLAVRWVETRTNPRSVRDAAQLCVDMKLGENLRRRCLEKSCEIAVQGGLLMSNVLSDLAKTGDTKYVATIRQFLQDERDLLAGALSGTFSYRIQQRDVALAMCLLLTKQEPKEYGFDVESDKVDLRYWESNYRFLPEKGKTAEEKREAAFKKWAAWEKANPDALKAAPPNEKK